MSHRTVTAFWIDRTLLLVSAASAIVIILGLGFLLGAAQAEPIGMLEDTARATPSDIERTPSGRPAVKTPASPKKAAVKPKKTTRPATSKDSVKKKSPVAASSSKSAAPVASRPAAPPTAQTGLPAMTGPAAGPAIPSPRVMTLQSDGGPAVRRIAAADRPAPPSSRFMNGGETAESRTGRGETYIAGFLGPTWPSSSNIELFDTILNPGTTQSDVRLKNSIAYGAKVGRYFDSLPWLGVEMEIFNTTAHEKQQTVTRMDPSSPPTSLEVRGLTMRVLTLAWNVVARYPGERFQPYAGVGLGAFFAHRKDAQSGDSASSTRPGLNAELGLRYKITEQVGAFGEWKFNHARFNFDPTNSLFGQQMTYNNHMLLFGVYLAFN